MFLKIKEKNFYNKKKQKLLKQKNFLKMNQNKKTLESQFSPQSFFGDFMEMNTPSPILPYLVLDFEDERLRHLDEIIDEHRQVRIEQEKRVKKRHKRKSCKPEKLLIPKAIFQRVVKQTIQENFITGYRIQSAALEILHIMTENFLQDFFYKANRCSVHAKRQTLQNEDLDLVKFFEK